jgi:hypothetical protein
MIRPKYVNTTVVFSMVSLFHGDFTLCLHILILLIVLINLWVQLYLVYKIWVRTSKSLFWVSCVI